MEEAARLEDQGWKYKLEVTFLEIYNECVRDLLIDDSSEQSKYFDAFLYVFFIFDSY